MTNLCTRLTGSQRRRRGRTALVRSWHSALDNQQTEGRAILILGNSSVPEHQREMGLFASMRTHYTAKGSRLSNLLVHLASSHLLHIYVFPITQRRVWCIFIHTKFRVKNICNLLLTFHLLFIVLDGNILNDYYFIVYGVYFIDFSCIIRFIYN